jgi:hypothetical protein
MKNTQTTVPKIIEHLNPVTEQFGLISEDSGQMQIPATVQEVPGFLYKLLTATEQAICDKATD